MMSEQFPTISLSALVYVELFQHIETIMKNGLKEHDRGFDKATEAAIRRAAKDAYQKLDKYYPTSDGAVYIIGTGSSLRTVSI